MPARSILNFVLRAFQGTWQTDPAAEKTLAFLREARFAGIMFWNGYGHWEPNHVGDEVLQARSKRIAELIPRFRQAGFSTGMNIHTVGFTYSPADIDEFGFQYQMGRDGAANRNSACPLCPRFREYLQRLAAAVALPGIEYILIDDDFNYMVAGGACHCPLHMAAMSKAIGRDVTRQQWLELAAGEAQHPRELSASWHTVQTDALLGAFEAFEQTVHAIDPSIRLGPMGINGWAFDFGPAAMRRLLQIARGPNNVPPVCRPSVASYWDWQRWAAHGACCHTSEISLRTLLPKDATGMVEIDSGAPWTLYDHSAEHLGFMIERGVATGTRDIAYLGSPDGPGDAMETQHPYTRMLARCRERWDAIAELIGENPVFEGVDCRTAAGLSRVDPLGDHFYGVPAMSLGRIGLPLAPTGQWTTILYGRQPWLIGAGELPAYISRGGIIDAAAIESISRMGCATLIGEASVEDWPAAPVGLLMSNHPLNGPAAGRHFSNLGPLRKICRKLVGKFDDAQVLSWWLSPRFERLSPAEVAIERDGRRIVLLSYDLSQQTPERQILVASDLRQHFFHNVCRWIARGPLPALLKDGVDVHLFCMRSNDSRRRILTLINNGFNRFERLTIELASRPSTIRTVRPDGKIETVSPELRQKEDHCELILKGELVPAPFEVRVLDMM